MARGNGIEQRGKSQATVKAEGPSVGVEKGPKSTGSKGGKTNAQMKAMGRNLAKIANQKKPMSMVRKMGI